MIVEFFLLLLFSCRLEAINYTYNTTIDLNTPFHVSHSPGNSWHFWWLIRSAPTFTLQPGDTVQGTISFAENQALQFSGPVDFANVALFFRDWTNEIQNRTLITSSLNGVAGSLTSPNPRVASTQSPGFNLTVGSANISTSNLVSFTSFSYSAQVLSGGGSYIPYYFEAHTPNDMPGAISVIPEPSVISLIGIGLIILARKRGAEGEMKQPNYAQIMAKPF